MPAIAAVSDGVIIKKLVDFDIFEQPSGELKKRTHPIWHQVCYALDSKIKIHNLYLRLKQNRNLILTTIKESRGMLTCYCPENAIQTSISSIESNNSDIETTTAISKKPYRCPQLMFEIEIPPKDWESIRPKSVIYNEKGRYGTGRQYTVLQPGWTDVVYKLCWEKTKLPCAFSFRRAKCYEHGKGAYIRIFGKCKECESMFEAHCLKKPKPGSIVKFAIKTSDTRGIPHTEKRQLKGHLRAEIQKELSHKKAEAWRCEATAMMEYGDVVPAHLYSSSVLRKARQEGKDKELGVFNVHDPIALIQNLKYNIEFAGTIREVGLNKFYCMYWNDMQLDLYKDFIKSRHPLTIDATGSLVQRLARPNGQSGAIFLYQAVIQGVKGILPVIQMVSEKHDANMISYWLKEWLRCGINIPKDTVTDFSLALLNGISLAFNECTLKTYLSRCFRCLSCEYAQDNSPRCFLRLDIAHFIKMVINWKCFNGQASRVKDFYVRTIGVMTSCDSVHELEKMMLALLTVALCESQQTDDSCICTKQEKLLLNCIRSFSLPDSIQSIDEDNIDQLPEDNDDTYPDPQLINLTEVLAQATNTKSFEHLNPYYLPSLVKPFVRICQYYPLWTNVMTPISETKNAVASSARSEAYFNNLKNNTLGDEGKPLRVDKFLIRHMRSITGICKIERAAYNMKLNDSGDSLVPDRFPDDSHNTPSLLEMSLIEESQNFDETEKRTMQSDSDVTSQMTTCLNEEENWRGQNRKSRSKQTAITQQRPSSKKGKYLRPHPDVELIHNRPLRRRRDLTIQNGGTVMINSQKIYLSFTCPFDSIAEVIATACADSAQYKSLVEIGSETSMFLRLVLDYITNGLRKEWYVERAVFLITTLDKDGSLINCSCNIENFLTKILDDFPSVTEAGICRSCEYNSQRNIPVIPVDSKPIIMDGLTTGLQKSIEQYFTKIQITCRNCQSKMNITRSPKEHLLIDTEHSFLYELSAQLGYPNAPKNIALSAIPVSLTIHDRRYHLIGVIDFEPPLTPKGIGHYIAFCRRITGEWEKRDSLNSRAERIPQTSLNNVTITPTISFYINV